MKFGVASLMLFMHNQSSQPIFERAWRVDFCRHEREVMRAPGASGRAYEQEKGSLAQTASRRAA